MRVLIHRHPFRAPCRRRSARQWLARGRGGPDARAGRRRRRRRAAREGPAPRNRDQTRVAPVRPPTSATVTRPLRAAMVPPSSCRRRCGDAPPEHLRGRSLNSRAAQHHPNRRATASRPSSMSASASVDRLLLPGAGVVSLAVCERVAPALRVLRMAGLQPPTELAEKRPARRATRPVQRVVVDRVRGPGARLRRRARHSTASAPLTHLRQHQRRLEDLGCLTRESEPNERAA